MDGQFLATLPALPHKIYLALGGNLGERQANLQAALDRLRAGGHLHVQRLSGIYETDPVGFADQPRFLNVALEAVTGLAPLALLDYLKQIEVSLGREPTFRNGPRPIDLDIIFYDDLVLEDERLQIPHPRLRGRGFVLAPLAELCPDYIHPSLQITVSQLLFEINLMEAGVNSWLNPPELELPLPRYLFVTGRLAESWLEGFLADISPRLGFDYQIAALPIDVAAFLTCRYIADKLILADDAAQTLDLIILPGFAGGEIELIEKATGIKVVRGPTELAQIEPFLAGLSEQREQIVATPRAATYYTEAQLRQMQQHLTDANIRIYTDGERIFAFNNQYFGSALPTEKELRTLFRLFKIENAAHAYYLGREFHKAAICLKLGHIYHQDRDIGIDGL